MSGLDLGIALDDIMVMSRVRGSLKICEERWRVRPKARFFILRTHRMEQLSTTPMFTAGLIDNAASDAGPSGR